MILRTLVLAFAMSLAASVQLYAQAKSPVEGVWKVAEVQVIGGANPGTNATPQPGFYIFTRGHYSIVTINADKPRTVIAQGQGRGRGRGQTPLSDADKIALYDHWGPVTANSGTYTIQGNVVTTKPLVAKNEGAMQGTPQGREFKIEGSTLWLTTKPAAGQTGAETRTKLTRLE